VSAYFNFIEEQRTLIQFGDLEEHHIKSQKNYPELVNDPENIIVLSEINHDYATLLQCEEENFPLLCPWQATRLRKEMPELTEQVNYWLSERGRESGKYTSIEERKKAGKKSAEKRKANGTMDASIEMMAIVNRERIYPPAKWYWRTNIETGTIERKLWKKPEGKGWQEGKGPWAEGSNRTSYTRLRVKCTITGHEGTQQSLARWQKNRGIDPSNRKFID